MRILHTSDLHLGMAWKEHSRAADQDRVLDEILALCETRDIDLLLVAGDVFSDRLYDHRVRHEEIARRLLTRLRAHLRRSMAVCLLRGNHDPLPLFRLMDTLASEMAGTDRLPLVVAALPGIYRIPGRESALQIVAVPYVEPKRLATEPFATEVTPNQQLLDLTGLLGMRVQQLCDTADPRVPAIFTAHYTVDAPLIRTDQYLELNYHRDLTLRRDWLPGFTRYNALGHIHMQQELRLAEKPTWYSGAPDRMNLGELEYTPSVLVVTTPDAPGGRAEVEIVRLVTSTEWVKDELAGPRAVAHFCKQWAGRDPLGEVRVRDVPPSDHGAVEVQLRQAAPRVEIRWPSALDYEATPVVSAIDYRDVHGTVQAYLEHSFTGQPELHERLQRSFAALLAGSEHGSEEIAV